MLPSEIVERTRTTYDGPLVVGEDLMGFEIGDDVPVFDGRGPKRTREGASERLRPATQWRWPSTSASHRRASVAGPARGEQRLQYKLG
jgi:hypothetical protein